MTARTPTLLALILLPAVLVAAGRYAPVPEVPADLEDRERWVDMMKGVEAKIPAAKDVAIPRYPDAVITSVSLMDGMRILHVITTDPMEKVRVWYEKKLEGWNHATKMMTPCFFKDEIEDFDFLRPEKGKRPFLCLTPVIPGGDHTKLVPGAQTRLQIYMDE